MVTLYIDNIPYEVAEHKNLLETVLDLGFDLPYFCWHPALGSVGACRQCAVKQFKDESDSKGRIVMACMTPVTDTMRISIDDPEVTAFRAGVIEWLMINHPHDCPVCDEGGECHLQDMTVMTGHNYRRFRFKKRTFRNQYLGPFLNHEMNRCITCYRCVRFYDDYAGGHDLQAMAAHNHIYFGRHQEGVLENEFSGNLVEICPTGVFTDKTLKSHYARKWDLQHAPSVCHHCGLGCNILAGERGGVLRRILNRFNSQVNGYFICDRGRFGYEFVNSEKRIHHPLLPGDGQPEEVRVREAMEWLQGILQNGEVIGIGSPRASLESNFALRELVGKDNFYNGLSASDSEVIKKVFTILRQNPQRIASMKQAEESDAVLILGEDVTNTAPRLALSLRQAAVRKPREKAMQLGIEAWHDAALRDVMQKDHGPFYVATPDATKLDELATRVFRADPTDIARLGFAVAHELDEEAPAVPGLSEEERKLAAEVADALRTADRPLIVSGCSLKSTAVTKAASNVLKALRNNQESRICFTVPECNSMGLPFFEAENLEQAFKRAADTGVETVIVLENDLYRRAPEKTVDSFLTSSGKLIVIDHLQNNTVMRADLILPAATFAGSSGTLVSNEGRAQRFFRAYQPSEDVRDSWRWIAEISSHRSTSSDARFQKLDDVLSAMAATIPALSRVTEITADAGFRISGQQIPRMPERYSGRTAMNADRMIHEPKPPEDPDSPLSHSMEGFHGPVPPELKSHYWLPGWNSVQSLNKSGSETRGNTDDDNPGLRLFEEHSSAEPSFFTDIPEASHAADDQWLIVPLYHIYGSGELSVHAPSVAERVPEPFLALNREDAKELDVTNGERIRAQHGEDVVTLPVRIRPQLPRRTVGFPMHLPGMGYISLPAYCELRHGGADV